ncbi:hypothetical protein ACOMHN_054071 [Nucella lapillus]
MKKEENLEASLSLKGKIFLLAVVDQSLSNRLRSQIPGGTVVYKDTTNGAGLYAVLTDLRPHSHQGRRIWRLDYTNRTTVGFAVRRYKKYCRRRRTRLDTGNAPLQEKVIRDSPLKMSKLPPSRGKDLLMAHQRQHQQPKHPLQDDAHAEAPPSSSTLTPQPTSSPLTPSSLIDSPQPKRRTSSNIHTPSPLTHTPDRPSQHKHQGTSLLKNILEHSSTARVPETLSELLTREEYQACLHAEEREREKIEKAELAGVEVYDAMMFFEEEMEDQFCRMLSRRVWLSKTRVQGVYDQVLKDNKKISIRVDHVSMPYRPIFSLFSTYPRAGFDFPPGLPPPPLLHCCPPEFPDHLLHHSDHAQGDVEVTERKDEESARSSGNGFCPEGGDQPELQGRGSPHKETHQQDNQHEVQEKGPDLEDCPQLNPHQPGLQHAGPREKDPHQQDHQREEQSKGSLPEGHPQLSPLQPELQNTGPHEKDPYQQDHLGKPQGEGLLLKNRPQSGHSQPELQAARPCQEDHHHQPMPQAARPCKEDQHHQPMPQAAEPLKKEGPPQRSPEPKRTGELEDEEASERPNTSQKNGQVLQTGSSTRPEDATAAADWPRDGEAVKKSRRRLFTDRWLTNSEGRQSRLAPEPPSHKFAATVAKFRRWERKYCELCQKHFYDPLNAHLRWPAHLAKVNTPNLYRELNTVVSKFPSLETFLQSAQKPGEHVEDDTLPGSDLPGTSLTHINTKPPPANKLSSNRSHQGPVSPKGLVVKKVHPEKWMNHGAANERSLYSGSSLSSSDRLQTTITNVCIDSDCQTDAKTSTSSHFEKPERNLCHTVPKTNLPGMTGPVEGLNQKETKQRQRRRSEVMVKKLAQENIGVQLLAKRLQKLFTRRT